MKNTIGLLILLGAVFIAAAALLGYVLHLEAGNQIYRLLAIIYLCIPGVLAYFMSKKYDIKLSLRNTRPLILSLSLILPIVLLVFAMSITFAFSLDEAKDSLMIAPMHGLTIKHNVFQIVRFSSNIALLTLFYGCTLQLVIALGEEVMWRGYFLTLLKFDGFWKKSLVLGLLSGLWQVPLILLFGWFYPEHLVLGPVWMVLLSLLISPILLYLRISSASLLAPTIFHAFFYSMASLLPYFMSEPNYLIGGMTGLAGFIALLGINVLFQPLYKKVEEDTISKEENT